MSQPKMHRILRRPRSEVGTPNVRLRLRLEFCESLAAKAPTTPPNLNARMTTRTRQTTKFNAGTSLCPHNLARNSRKTNLARNSRKMTLPLGSRTPFSLRIFHAGIFSRGKHFLFLQDLGLLLTPCKKFQLFVGLVENPLISQKVKV